MIKVNGENLNINNIRLSDFLKKNGFDENRVAVELNGTIIKRGSYGDYILIEGDKVEIVCFVGGG